MCNRTVYLVRRYVVYGNNEGFEIPTLDENTHCSSDEPTRWHPCSIHPNRSDAEAEARARNRDVRRTLNPLWLRDCLDAMPEVPVSDLSPQPDLLAAGVRIPLLELVHSQYGDYESNDNQAHWFDDHADGWPDDVREAVWLQLAVNVGFFDVMPIQVDDET